MFGTCIHRLPTAGLAVLCIRGTVAIANAIAYSKINRIRTWHAESRVLSCRAGARGAEDFAFDASETFALLIHFSWVLIDLGDLSVVP